MKNQPTRTLVGQTPSLAGKTVTLRGWVNTKRDHGKVTFIDLRDYTGIIQCVGVGKLGDLSVESVVEVTGLVKERPASMTNTAIPTGGIELEVQDYVILNKAHELPVAVEGDGYDISEEVRLKYRYLDLRRARLQKNMRLRSQFIEAVRKALFEREFVEIETPLLTKSTKEGARDFLVPSRFQPGKFYALPQSPQQYKQLLMTAGFERYFQVARCLRDEDLRADRGFELTQLDLEMSFVTQDELMETMETVVKTAVKQVGGKLQQENFPVVTYQEAMEKYGADRFDLRSEAEKKDGTLAFAWVVNWPFFKKVDTKDAAEVRDGKSGWTFTHNPFSAPNPEDLENHLAGKNIDTIVTQQYDLVCNGYEVGGGSIRAHRPEVLRQTFRIMGYSDAEIESGIGHMLRAFEVGTPPHGGIALGLDRFLMVLAGETSMKEVVAFPMTSSGRTSVMDAPSEITDEQLDEVGLQRAASDLPPHEAILHKLQVAGVSYDYYVHKPVFTSEEAAAIRNTDVNSGAKSLVLAADNEFILHVLPGGERADLDKLKKLLGVKKLVMASRDSVAAKTGLEVGAIPPFGSVLGMKTYLDTRLAAHETISFNCGKHDRSVDMRYADYLKVEQPVEVE